MKKKVAFGLIIIAFLMIAVGIFSILFDDNGKNQSIKILKNAGIDAYLTAVFPGVELNKNLLDDADFVNLMLSDTIKKYKFQYQEIQGSEDEYINFLEYSKAYREKYNKDVTVKDFSDIVSIKNLKKVDDNTFLVSREDVSECLDENLESCYFSHSLFFAPKGTVVFENLNRKNNQITGKVIKETVFEGKKYQYSGEFEFNYKKVNNKYEGVSFIVKKLDK